MKEYKVNKKLITFLTVISIGITIYLAIITLYSKTEVTRSLETQIFPNVKNLKVECVPQTNRFNSKACDLIEIKVPSLASVYDDKGEKAKLANLVVNSEILDDNIEDWLRKSYNKEEASIMSDQIRILYRDNVVINDDFRGSNPLSK
ncbi:MAG: hypothetical protein RR601_05290 [Erysipelotrichales bacterium]